MLNGVRNMNEKKSPEMKVPANVPDIWEQPSTETNKCAGAELDYYDAFYSEIKPLLIGLSVFGKLPYKRTKYRKCESTCMSWQFVYWVVHYVVLSLIGMEQLYESWQDLMKKEVDFSTTIEHGVIFSVILLLHFPTPLCVLYERKAIMELLNSWPPLLEQLEITLGEKFTACYSTIIKIAVWLEPFVVLGIVFVERNLLLRGKYWRLLLYFSVFQASNYLIVMWFLCCLEMKNIAKKIKNAIEKISTGGPYTLYGGHSLEDLRILWLRLSVVAQNTGEAFALSIITLSTHLVTTFIISWFSVISSFIHPEYKNRADYVTIGLITGMMVFILCEPAHRVTEAVGGKIIQALSFIELTHLPPHAQKQVHDFTRTVELNYPIVSLSGITPVNRSWLPSVAASVVTYLIVLVQFQASARP